MAIEIIKHECQYSSVVTHRENGKIHRTDGPAFIQKFKSGWAAWCVYKNGVLLPQEAFEHVIDPSTGEVLDQVSFDLIYNML